MKLEHKKLIPGIVVGAALLTATATADTASYNFDDGPQGWTNVQTSTTGPVEFISDTNTQGGRIDQQYAGDGSLRPDPFSSRDAVHSVALWMRSPAFSLTSTNEISFGLIGGTHGSAPASDADASLTVPSTGSGWQGMVLRRVSDGVFILSGNRSGNGQDTHETISWDAATVAAAIAGDDPTETYTLDLIDSYSGGWGWLGADDVIIDDLFAGDSDQDGLQDADEQVIIDHAAAQVPSVTLTLADIEGPLDPAPVDSDYDEDDSTDANEILVTLTDPTNPDTDDDGLLDGHESNDDFWTSETETGTDPFNPDTDGDGLLDGVENPELAYDPGNPTTQPGTDPNVEDDDGDGLLDGDEINLGSDPTDETSLPTIYGDLTLVGCDDFAYSDGALSGLNGGDGFDFDNDLFVNTFIGHTTSAAPWTGGGQIVSEGLETTNDAAFRRHEAPVELDGAVFAGADYDAEVIYFRVDITRDAGVSWSGLSSYNGTSEGVFFGKNTAATEWIFIIRGASPENGEYSTGIPVDDQPHTLVGKIDYANEEIKMWIDADLSGSEASAPADASSTYTFGVPSTVTRLASGPGGAVTWDNLIVAREWSALSKFPWIEPAATIRIVDTSFDTATRTFSLTWESDPAATYTLWESPDLSAGSWTEVDNAISGGAGATTTYPLAGLSAAQTERFYRVSENP